MNPTRSLPAPRSSAPARLAAALVAAALAGPLAAARGPQEGATVWQALPLPAFATPSPARLVPPALVDGKHLLGEWDASRPAWLREGAVLPAPVLEALLARSLEEDGRGATVQTDVDALLVRGDVRALERVAAETASLEAQLAALEVELEVRIAVDGEAVLARTLRVLPGREAVLGARELTTVLLGHEARVTSDSAVADPAPGVLATGLTLHLVALRGPDREVQVQGFLDLARPVPGEDPSFDAGLPDFALLELPRLHVVQAAFAGPAGEQEPLELAVTPGAGGPPPVQVRIAARTAPAAPVDADRWRVVDVTALAHAARRLPALHPGPPLIGEEDEPAPWSRGPLGPPALVSFVARTASAGPRPLWTDRLLLLPPGSGDLEREVREFQRVLSTARDGFATLTLRGPDLTAVLPVARGSRMRLVVGREEARVVDYDVEIAPETWLSEPVVERVLDGVCIDGWLLADRMRCSSWKARSVGQREIAPDGIALGRLLLVERTLDARESELTAAARSELLPELGATLVPRPR